MIVEWIDVDSLHGIDSISISMHGIYYMSYTEDLLDDLIKNFKDSEFYKPLVEKILVEKQRRAKLEE